MHRGLTHLPHIHLLLEIFHNLPDRFFLLTNTLLDTYHRFLEQKIGIKLGNNDIVLGVAEAGYQYFGIRKKNTKNILGKHIYSLNEQGYRNEQGDKYDYRISDIDKL